MEESLPHLAVEVQAVGWKPCICRPAREAAEDGRGWGNTASSGGGLYNEGTVTLNGDSRISGNTTPGSDGGVFNDGTLTLNGSAAISGNTTGGIGAGIFDEGGTVTMTGTATITANTAGLDGGGIFNKGGTLSGVVAGVNVVNNGPDDIVSFWDTCG